MGNNLEFIKESIKISFYEMIEFKGNLYSSIINMVISIVLSIFLLIILNNSFRFNFGIEEIVIFTFLKQIGNNIFMPFVKFNSRVFLCVVNGKFNTFLTKSKNVFLMYLFNGFKVRLVLNTVLLIIFLFIVLIYFNLNFKSFLPIFLVSVIVFGYLNISIIYCIDSIGFFNIDVGTKTFFRANNELSSYPPTIYEQFTYKYIFFLSPMILHGVSTLYYFDRLPLSYFLMTLVIAFLLSIIFNLITYYFWKYGLKKYEASG